MILTGKVKVYVSDDDGREMILDIYGPGDYVGEMALDGRPRSASVMTLEPTTCSVVMRDELRNAISANPDIAMSLIATLIDRARIATDNVKNLALMDVYGRVARLLLSLAKEEGGKLVVPERMTQQDIADRVGASRDMISRIFKDLTIGGYVTHREPDDHDPPQAAGALVTRARPVRPLGRLGRQKPRQGLPTLSNIPVPARPISGCPGATLPLQCVHALRSVAADPRRQGDRHVHPSTDRCGHIGRCRHRDRRRRV